MTKEELFERFKGSRFSVINDKVAEIQNIYSNSFEFPSRPKMTNTAFYPKSGNKRLEFELEMEPTSQAGYFNCNLYFIGRKRDLIAFLERKYITDIPKPKSFHEALSYSKEPYYAYPKECTDEVEIYGDVYKINMKIENSSLFLSINCKNYFSVKHIPFSPRNIGKGNVGEGESISYDKFHKKDLHTIWQTEIMLENQKYFFKEVALEGYLWGGINKETNRAILSGRYRRQSPRYCTLYELSNADISIYFVYLTGGCVLVDTY